MATIPYANVIDRKHLPVDAQDVVTEARLVIAGEYQGAAPSREFTEIALSGGGTEYGDVYPWPIVYSRIPNASNNNTYRAARSFKLPTSFNPFQDVANSVGNDNEGTHTNITNSANAYDGSSSTAASNTAAGAATYILKYINFDLGTTISTAYGAFLRYQWNDSPSDSPSLDGSYMRVTHAPSLEVLATDDVYSSTYYVPLTLTGDEAVSVYMVCPRDARASTVNMGTPGDFKGFTTTITVFIRDTVASGDLKIFDLHGLVLNGAALDALGDKQIRVPVSSPKTVTVDYHVPMAASHTITGWPGGDLTADVARQSYQEGTTIIEFEATNRSLGLSTLDREEEDRVRRETFGITMGTRR